MPDRLRLITPGGIPAPPEAASQLLADVGVPRDDLHYRVGSSITIVERGMLNEAGPGQGLGHGASEQDAPGAGLQEPLRAGGRALNPAQARGPHAPVTPLEPLVSSPADGFGGRAEAAADVLHAHDQPQTPSRSRRQSGDLVRCRLARDRTQISHTGAERDCVLRLLRVQPCIGALS